MHPGRSSQPWPPSTEPCHSAPQPMPPWAGPTRWGICSAGKISHDFIIALKTLSAQEHTVVAIASRELAHAQEYARKNGIPRAYGSYKELARDPDIDVVYVGVINPQHLPVGRLFLRAGKPVLLEKPLGMNAAEVRELVQEARASNVFLMEAFWTRFFPVSGRIRTLLAQGALGQVKMVRAAVAIHMSNVPRLVEKDLGGGALLDLGCYCVQFACMVFGGEKPQSILASGFLHETGVDETTSIILNYSRKRQAVLTCSFMVNLPNQAAIAGTQGIIEIPDYMSKPTDMLFNGERWECPLPPPSQPLNFERDTGLRYEAQHVRECLLQGLKESPVMSLADSELVASILDEVRKQLGVKYTQDQSS
ncbi:trans-1,2-dihydrobenzene-1,2-diol dehydrogenase [Alligator mississippiensis]|nr:trans-1,2-dihydrobenzene-1,2-diol dehydrogenase [Alligator mississippiensis]